METLVIDWAEFAIRWVHVITGIAWIGSSFYFVALDLSLRQPPDLPAGVAGEEWQVHGGGFYQMRKFTVAPPNMPDELIWFKWESYSTWISGFFLMAVVYYGSSELYLIDRSVADLGTWQAILISLACLVAGWLAYDLTCKSPVAKSDTMLTIVVFAGIVAIGWGFTQVFSGRAAFLHTGAVIATIMSANVAMLIIPNQKKTVAALLAGEKPDPALGIEAKQRSTHNNYLTLPVLFLMLSNHYPLAYATAYNWIIIALVLLIGILIRHFFNTMHQGKGFALWTWLISAIAFVIIVWLSQAGPPTHDAVESTTGIDTTLLTDQRFVEVREIVLSRCSMCHAGEPVWEGITRPPKNVVLETDRQIAVNAAQIYLQAGRSNAMPPGNITGMAATERTVLTGWFENATGTTANFLW